MSKVKLILDRSNTELCKNLTEFFLEQDVEFEIVFSKNLEESALDIDNEAITVDLTEKIKCENFEQADIVANDNINTENINIGGIMENTKNDEHYEAQSETKTVEVAETNHDAKTESAQVLSQFVRNSNKLEKRISDIFMTVGIPAHIKGYQFLREAVRLIIQKPDMINCITKQLYPQVAEKFNTSASKVERAIRHAIEVGWNRGRVDNINNEFGVRAFCAKDKPTNGEFIAVVADKMILEGA